jgi:hypothetical protein
MVGLGWRGTWDVAWPGSRIEFELCSVMRRILSSGCRGLCGVLLTVGHLGVALEKDVAGGAWLLHGRVSPCA